MPQREVTLPSGARGKVRGLKGEEINLFANRQSARRNRTSMQVLKNVWLETHDGGALYDNDIDWDKAPQCDRFVALFYARIATYGPQYDFKWQCDDSTCRKRFEWGLNLEEDLEVETLPDATCTAFLNGNRFTTEIVDSEGTTRQVVFQLLTPKLENKIEQVVNMAPKERATAGIAQRIVSIEGVENGKGPIKRFLNDLDAGAVLDLLEAMDEVDGGIQTQIEIECPHCGNVMEIEIPFQDEFWSPSRRKRSTES